MTKMYLFSSSFSLDWSFRHLFGFLLTKRNMAGGCSLFKLSSTKITFNSCIYLLINLLLLCCNWFVSILFHTCTKSEALLLPFWYLSFFFFFNWLLNFFGFSESLHWLLKTSFHFRCSMCC